MGHSQAEKLASHQRIVNIAARRFRELGIDGVSVAEIMGEAGLTVGGFYKHFSSKDELISEALIAAFKDIEPVATAIAASPKQGLQMYLSEDHRDYPGAGCPISALSNDVSRKSDSARQAYTEHAELLLDVLTKAAPGKAPSTQRKEAILILTACVGSVAIARAVSDPKLSRQILEGTLEQLLGLFSSQRGRC